jgi:vacuolar-type H+-ATPase subunit I/STV1
MKEIELESLILRINSLRTTTIRNKGRYEELKKSETTMLGDLKEEFGIDTIEEAEELLHKKHNRIKELKNQLESVEQRLLKLMK